jgi:hypothetical protein
MMTQITNMQDLCDHFGAEHPAGLNRRLYKDTACGASISVLVRNPHNPRPRRLEMVVEESTYEVQKYRYQRLHVMVWVDQNREAETAPLEARLVSVVRRGQVVEDPQELEGVRRALSIDDPSFFWGSVGYLPHTVEASHSGQGWAVSLEIDDPTKSTKPCLRIVGIAVDDHQLSSYFGDSLNEAYGECRWFDDWAEASGWNRNRFFSCGPARTEFWPQDPGECRRGGPVTLDELKASATRSITHGTTTKLVWEFDHRQTAEVVVVSAYIRRSGDGCELLKIWHEEGDQGGIPRPETDVVEWWQANRDEPWYHAVEVFFSLDKGLGDITLEKLREQNWEPSDEVQLDNDPNDPDLIQITKIFRNTDKALGWRSDRDGDFVWVHNGNSLWRQLTLETELRSFTIQSIVEGSDATVDSDVFDIPCEVEEVEKWMSEMEDQTSDLWDRDNHDWYYAFVDDICVGQFKTGWDDDAFEAWETKDPVLTEREQQIVLRWLGRDAYTGYRSGAFRAYKRQRVLTTRVWVERFDPDWMC